MKCNSAVLCIFNDPASLNINDIFVSKYYIFPKRLLSYSRSQNVPQWSGNCKTVAVKSEKVMQSLFAYRSKFFNSNQERCCVFSTENTDFKCQF